MDRGGALGKANGKRRGLEVDTLPARSRSSERPMRPEGVREGTGGQGTLTVAGIVNTLLGLE